MRFGELREAAHTHTSTLTKVLGELEASNEVLRQGPKGRYFWYLPEGPYNPDEEDPWKTDPAIERVSSIFDYAARILNPPQPAAAASAPRPAARSRSSGRPAGPAARA